VPTLFGAVLVESHATQGPGDLSALGDRPDTLLFTTPVLGGPLSICGSARATVWITCDAVDTDLAARLVQILPDGRQMLLVDGIVRASLQDDRSAPNWLDPDTPYELSIELAPLAATIPQGHQLGLYLVPSNFDLFDTNMQDGSPFSDSPSAVPVFAEVQILMDSLHPSRLIIPSVLCECPGTSIHVCQNGECGDRLPCYQHLSQALSRSCNGAVVKAGSGFFEEDPELAAAKHVTLCGGWNEAFTVVEGVTEIAGSLTLSRGSISITNLVIRGDNSKAN
jgi:hypothetical protein